MRANDLPTDFANAVHAALRLWAMDPAAGSPLADMILVRREMNDGNLRRATNQVLQAALDRLAAERPHDAALLRARFLDNTPVATTARTHNVAEITLYKKQRRAIERLAAILLDMEQKVMSDRRSTLTARLPPLSYDRLFGVEAPLATLRSLLLAPDGPKLIAIEGIGGIGKTALAHQLARQLMHQERTFADFGWVSAQQSLLEPTGGIRPTNAAALTAQALIEALTTQLMTDAAGIMPVAPDRALLALETRLHEVPHLIVVDNLETVADVESLLPTLLRLADSSKFLLTSRETFQGQAGIYHFTVPELSETDALDLVRHEARLQGLTHVAGANTDELRPIYATVGGNPLALRLVTGQLQILTLQQVLENLREAKGKRIEDLYNYIYWSAWQRLPATAQDVLTLMPLFAHDGANLTALLEVSDLAEDELVEALTYLVKLSLVNLSGDLHTRRYSIHRLTETFLLKEVIKWRGEQEAPA